MLIIPIVCSTTKLKRLMPPKALCVVFRSYFTFRLIPRKERLWKFSVCKSLFAVVRGIDSVAIPYRIPAQSLNLYATHPRRAGKCAFLILLIHCWVLPVTFSSICLALLAKSDVGVLKQGSKQQTCVCQANVSQTC